MSSLLLLLTLSAADVCAPVAPGPKRDPDALRAYLAVGQEELARNQPRSAAAAFHAALELDPSSVAARQGLEGACRQLAPDDAFSQAVALMDAGDRRGAAQRFEAIRVAKNDLGAALLEGICAYELGDDERARALLLEASSSPDLAASAELFLGLLALRSGEGAEADQRFAAAALGGETLRATAFELSKLSARDGKLVVAAQLSGGYDSNVELLPSTSASGTGDAAGSLTASVTTRPLGRSGPYARVGGGYRKQLELGSADVGDAAATVGWQLGRGTAHGSADYAFEFLAFGGAPFVLAHLLGLRGQVPLGPLVVGGEYVARFQSFLADVNQGYSGTVHTARLGVAWSPSQRWGLGAGYVLAWDLARLPELASFGHGPEVSGSVAFSRDLRLVATAGYRHRAFDAVDPDYGVTRVDDRLDGSARLELDLGWYTTLFIALEGHAQLSNVEDVAFTRFAAWAGASIAARVF